LQSLTAKTKKGNTHGMDEVLAFKGDELPVEPVLSNKMNQEISTREMEEVQMTAPMRLINFENFKMLDHIPRSNEIIQGVIELHQISNRKETFIIFISHRWFQFGLPDLITNVKFRIIIQAVTKLRHQVGLDKTLYIWVDYFCIDQDDFDKKMAGIDSLPAYVMNSDCLFSPFCNEASKSIVSVENFSCPLAELYPGRTDLNLQCLADHGCEYFGRAWCRLEMYLGSHAHLPPNGFNFFFRKQINRTDRPHFFSISELGDTLFTLPSLNASWLQKLNPVHGALTSKDDRNSVINIMKKFPLPKDVAVGYVGDLKDGVKCGFGTLIYDNCDKYVGEWKDGKRHGTGTHFYANGDRYEGSWENDMASGRGLQLYADGRRYYGDWKFNQKCGRGDELFPDGSLYQGMFTSGEQHGFGTVFTLAGAIFQAKYRQGKTQCVIFSAPEGTTLCCGAERSVMCGPLDDPIPCTLPLCCVCKAVCPRPQPNTKRLTPNSRAKVMDDPGQLSNQFPVSMFMQDRITRPCNEKGVVELDYDQCYQVRIIINHTSTVARIFLFFIRIAELSNPDIKHVSFNSATKEISYEITSRKLATTIESDWNQLTRGVAVTTVTALHVGK